MGMLAALKARADEREDGSDGYYVRLHDGSKLGPMEGAPCPPLCPRRRPLVNTPRCFPPPRADALLDLRALAAVEGGGAEGRGDERRAATVRAACVPLAAPPQTGAGQIR